MRFEKKQAIRRPIEIVNQEIVRYVTTHCGWTFGTRHGETYPLELSPHFPWPHQESFGLPSVVVCFFAREGCLTLWWTISNSTPHLPRKTVYDCEWKWFSRKYQNYLRLVHELWRRDDGSATGILSIDDCRWSVLAIRNTLRAFGRSVGARCKQDPIKYRIWNGEKWFQHTRIEKKNKSDGGFTSSL